MYNLFFLAIVLITPAHAYLDPGTGSMLLSVIIALIASLIYSIKGFTFKIKSFTSMLFGKKVKKIDSNDDIVFYNEGEQYFTTFYPVLEECQKRGLNFTYLYSDENDSVAKQLEGNDTHYIDKGNKAFFHLNTLQAKMCIMTTPGLDVLQIKRSKGVNHYCHLSHSTGGCRYEVFGVDYFDSVLVPNKYDKEFIEKLEEKRNLPHKDIRIVGTPYLDFTLEQLSTINIDKPKEKTILLSPTWGEHGLLNEYGSELLEVLLSNEKYTVIVRPHPQSIEYEVPMLENLKNKFKDKKNLQWDNESNGLVSMSKASIMISDFSGIILDYIFLFSKPVISLPSTIDLRGKDYIDKNINLWQIDFYYQHTTILKEEDIVNLNQTIDSLLDTQKPIDTKAYQDYNPHSGKASMQTVDAIENMYKNINNGGK